MVDPIGFVGFFSGGVEGDIGLKPYVIVHLHRVVGVQTDPYGKKLQTFVFFNLVHFVACHAFAPFQKGFPQGGEICFSAVCREKAAGGEGKKKQNDKGKGGFFHSMSYLFAIGLRMFSTLIILSVCEKCVTKFREISVFL